MYRAILLSLVWLAAPDANTSAPSGAVPEGLAQRAWAVTDVVLAHHVSPPARQQMILNGFQARYRAARVPLPADLARKASKVVTVQDFQAFLNEEWALRSGATDSPDEPDTSGNAATRSRETPGSTASSPEDIFVSGLIEGVAGRARFLSAKELKVEQQIAANRYVGLQIALMFNSDLKRAQIGEVMAGGPADRAGVKRGDVIEEVDGKTTEGEDLRTVVDRLRGLEGTDVTIRVRNGKAAPRTYTITRGVLPRKTLEGVRYFGGADGQRLVDGPGLISYLRIKEIAGSTPHELRQLARTLEDEGVQALVLDLRGIGEVRFHPALLLADELLEAGVIGRMRMAERVETYRAEPDALFRGWPLAVLIDSRSSGVTTWLAAALKDNHRALIVGTSTGRVVGGADAAFAGIASALPLSDGGSFIELITGQLERGDGRPVGPLSFTPNTGSGRRMAARPANPESDGYFVPDVLLTPSPAAHAGGGTGVVLRFDGDAATATAHNRLRAQLGLPPVDSKPNAGRRLTLRDEVRR